MSSAWALIESEDHILLIRRALDRGRGGQWCLPGGTVWKNEQPAVACVREAYEETALRITIDHPIAVFDGAHYFRCTLNQNNAPIPPPRLSTRECIDSCWCSPSDILSLGTVMDLRRLIPLLDLCGLVPPTVNHEMDLAVPEQVFGG